MSANLFEERGTGLPLRNITAHEEKRLRQSWRRY